MNAYEHVSPCADRLGSVKTYSLFALFVGKKMNTKSLLLLMFIKSLKIHQLINAMYYFYCVEKSVKRDEKNAKKLNLEDKPIWKFKFIMNIFISIYL